MSCSCTCIVIPIVCKNGKIPPKNEEITNICFKFDFNIIQYVFLCIN